MSSLSPVLLEAYGSDCLAQPLPTDTLEIGIKHLGMNDLGEDLNGLHETRSGPIEVLMPVG